jgi:Ca2+-binding RTX toxin-like protein
MTNTISGTPGADSLSGDTNGADQFDFIEGLAGNDTLFGGNANDTLRGGADNDSLNGGIGNDSLDGNIGNDTLRGGGGTDFADGGDGNDVLLVGAEGGTISNFVGGAGFDVIDASAVTQFWWVQGVSSVEKIIMSGFDESWVGSNATETFEGRGGSDTIDSAGGHDTILGGDGIDLLTGGAGNDSLDGGLGFDYVYFTGATAAVEASLAKGKSTGGAGNDEIDNVEGLVGWTFADKLTGNGQDNALAGLEGNDTLDGGAGFDLVYYNSTGTGQVIDLGVGTSAGTLGSDRLFNIEGVVATNGSDSITGSGGNNRIYGLGGADTELGAGGADEMYGDAGADSLDGGNGNDTLFGGLDADKLLGAAQNDTLWGEAGNDSLEGGAGADSLTGGDGQDTLVGGFGGGDTLAGGLLGDIFKWREVDLSATWADARVTDFSAAGGDVIDLSDIDASAKKAGNQAFQVVEAFTKHGQMVMTYNAGTNTTQIDCQIDKDADIDFSLVVNGDVTGGAGLVL